MKFVKVAIAVIVCGVLMFATYIYVNGNKTGGAGGQPPSGGAPKQGGQAPGGDKKASAGGAKSPQSAGGFGGTGGGKPQNVTSIRSQIAKVTALHDYVFTTGEIEPQTSVDVFPEIGGKIKNIYVSLGSQVKKGDLIVKVDPSSPGMQYALNPVYAPIGGTITKMPVKQGATVSMNTVLTTIGDVENLQIRASVPERYVASLKNGLKADIMLEAYPDAVFTATVVRVAPVVDSVSRTKEVTLNFDQVDSRINAGMFAKVKLFTNVYDTAVVIPASAVLEKSGKKYIYIVNSDNTVSEREVVLGNTVDNVVQLLSGVNEGEKMVVEGMRVLGNGSAVKDISANNAGAI